MAKHIHHGVLVTSNYTGGHADLLHSNAGRLIAVLISHDEPTIEPVIFYDATSAAAGSEVAAFEVAPENTPYYVRFPREAAVQFGTALFCAPGNCDVHVWSLDYG